MRYHTWPRLPSDCGSVPRQSGLFGWRTLASNSSVVSCYFSHMLTLTCLAFQNHKPTTLTLLLAAPLTLSYPAPGADAGLYIYPNIFWWEFRDRSDSVQKWGLSQVSQVQRVLRPSPVSNLEDQPSLNSPRGQSIHRTLPPVLSLKIGLILHLYGKRREMGNVAFI